MAGDSPHQHTVPTAASSSAAMAEPSRSRWPIRRENGAGARRAGQSEARWAAGNMGGPIRSGKSKESRPQGRGRHGNDETTPTPLLTYPRIYICMTPPLYLHNPAPALSAPPVLNLGNFGIFFFLSGFFFL